jgi:hypothetical protein
MYTSIIEQCQGGLLLIASANWPLAESCARRAIESYLPYILQVV